MKAFFYCSEGNNVMFYSTFIVLPFVAVVALTLIGASVRIITIRARRSLYSRTLSKGQRARPCAVNPFVQEMVRVDHLDRRTSITVGLPRSKKPCNMHY